MSFCSTFKTVIFLFVSALLCTSTSYAQIENFKEFSRDFYKSAWETASYALNDKVGYDIIGYKDIPRGAYKTWNVNEDVSGEPLDARPQFTLDQLYVARTGGVDRGEIYSPDEIGKIYRENGLFYGGMGNSKVESIMIQKKYGLSPMEGVPGGEGSIDFSGFTQADYEKYRDTFRAVMQRSKERLEKKENVYGRSIISNPNTIWVMSGSGIVRYFLDNLEDNYENINKIFRKERGFDIAKVVDPSTPEEKAQRSIFLQWVRTKMQGILELQMESFRKHIDPAGTVISNIHGEDVIDFETHGSIVDHPGPSGRAQFSTKELVLKYWDGYIFRMWRDLTDKVLFASARINNGVVRARRIPTRKSVKYWHNQALQNGTVGFYQWMKDYGPRDLQGNKIDKPLTFDGGAAFANPDSSARGQERWNAVLDISRKLSHTKAFDPPTSKTGILLSFDTVNIHGWDKVFSMYVELKKSGVWSSFISDREILNGSEDLDDWEVIYIPAMDYTHTEVADELQSFVENGGTLVSVDPKVFTYDMSGNDISQYRNELFGTTGNPEESPPQSVRLTSQETPERIYSQNRTYKFTAADDAEVIGKYPDGSPAVVSNDVGKGQAIYWGAPLADIYLTSPYHDRDLDGRSDFYKNLEAKHGITDYSWIWDITVDNLETVTGSGEPDLPPVDQDIILE